MQIIPANQLLPFVSNQSSTTAFVGMTVYDTTSGAPVQLTGRPGQVNNIYPMLEVGSLYSYLANFKALPQHTYMMSYQEYTAGDYVTPVGVSVSETYAAKIMAPTFIRSLNVSLGCENQPDQSPVIVSQNSDSNILLSFIDDNGDPVDITSLTALTMSMLEADGSTVLTKSFGSDISLVDGSINQALVSFDAADFALLPAGDNDAQIAITMAGQVEAINVYSAISVEPGAV